MWAYQLSVARLSLWTTAAKVVEEWVTLRSVAVVASECRCNAFPATAWLGDEDSWSSRDLQPRVLRPAARLRRVDASETIGRVAREAKRSRSRERVVERTAKRSVAAFAREEV